MILWDRPATRGSRTMTNPDHYEEDGPTIPAAAVLHVTGKVLVGLALATLASTALVVYTSARAGKNARRRVDGAVAEIGRELRDAGEQMAQTARAALSSAKGSQGRRGGAPAH